MWEQAGRRSALDTEVRPGGARGQGYDGRWCYHILSSHSVLGTVLHLSPQSSCIQQGALG